MKMELLVGQELRSLNVGNAARHREQELTKVTVMKVGRKYFYTATDDCKERNDFWEQYHIDSWQQNTNYSATSKLYLSELEFALEKERLDILEYLRSYFDVFNSVNLSNDALNGIKRIIEANE